MRDIVVESQRDVVLDFGPITRKNAAGVPVAINLAAVDTKLWFTVKETALDPYAMAKLAKTYVVTGGGPTTVGFLVTTPSSTTVPNGTITIADTEIVTTDSATYWVWDLTLEEPSGRRETVERGAFKVIRSVTNP